MISHQTSPQRRISAVLSLFLALLLTGFNAWGADLVGRITAVEGELLRFVPGDEEWVPTVKDSPFGLDDTLYSDPDARAEIIMPNNAWIRLDGATQIQLIAATPETLEVDVASGVTRIYNKSTQGIVKATTPFGYVIAEPDSSFDLYVGDESAEVIGLSGVVDFVDVTDKAKYEVIPGSTSIIADAREVGVGDGALDRDWDAWNRVRDDVWEERLAASTRSAAFLPPELKTGAYELERKGSWERVSYEGEERDLWRPRDVGDDWAPYTAGRWTEWNGDNTWIPDEDFGYTTHHYGDWVHVNRTWYWAPPRRVERVVHWYPGRVAWISSGDSIGWVPLAPRERYYSHRRWGPDTVLVGALTAGIFAATMPHYMHHAVIVPRNRFYGVRL